MNYLLTSLFTLLILLALLSCNESFSFTKQPMNKLINVKMNPSISTQLNAFKFPFSFKSNFSKRETIVVPKDYTVAGEFAAFSGLLFVLFHEGGAGTNTAILFALISVFLAIQTGKVRFVFDGEALEVLIDKTGTEASLEKSRENFAVGGRNRWKYSTFTNWFFIPSKSVPILMYFKETQTSPQGQPHFFPVIMNPKILNDVMTERVGKK